MRALTALFLATVVDVVLGLMSLATRDPLPWLIAIAFTWFPLYIFFLTRGLKLGGGRVNLLEMQTYANIARAARNTDRIK